MREPESQRKPIAVAAADARGQPLVGAMSEPRPTGSGRRLSHTSNTARTQQQSRPRREPVAQSHTSPTPNARASAPTVATGRWRQARAAAGTSSAATAARGHAAETMLRPRSQPMIIETQDDVTEAVLGEMHRTPDPRTKELLALLVRHLHAFVRETQARPRRNSRTRSAIVNAIGKRTTPSHNEAMLLAGALGVSNLVCLMNNGAHGTRPTQANNLGPFYRAGAPQLRGRRLAAALAHARAEHCLQGPR